MPAAFNSFWLLFMRDRYFPEDGWQFENKLMSEKEAREQKEKLQSLPQIVDRFDIAIKKITLP